MNWKGSYGTADRVYRQSTTLQCEPKYRNILTAWRKSDSFQESLPSGIPPILQRWATYL